MACGEHQWREPDALTSNIARRKAIKAFTHLGFIIDERRGKGSHALIHDPSNALRKTVISRSDPIKHGTLKGMLTELRIKPEEFEQALRR